MAVSMSKQLVARVQKEHAAFGRAVRHYRLARAGTQAELALKCGVSLSTIAGIEGARAVPSFHLIVTIAEVLGVEVSALFKAEW